MADVFLPRHAWLPGPVFDLLRGAVAATGVVIASGVTGLEPLTATTNNLHGIGAVRGFAPLYSTTGGLPAVVARLSNVLILAIALVVMANLGAGMGSVLVLRWLWEGINLWSELAAIATSLVVAPILLFTTSVEWLRLGVMAAATTAVAIGAGVALVPAWWGRVREG